MRKGTERVNTAQAPTEMAERSRENMIFSFNLTAVLGACVAETLIYVPMLSLYLPEKFSIVA